MVPHKEKDPTAETRDLPDDITKPHTQVIARHAVHTDSFVPAGVVSQDDTHRLATFPPPQHHRVPPEELQLLCLILVEAHTHTPSSEGIHTHD